MRLDSWRIPEHVIVDALKLGQKPKELVCLGCAAKVELVSTVYPALSKLSEWLSSRTKIRLQHRDDVYLFSSDGDYEVNRAKYSIQDLNRGLTNQVREDIWRFKPTGIVMLANFMPMPSKEKLYEAMLSFYRAAATTDWPFTVGKGHTIQIAKNPEEEYIVVDYISSNGDKFNCVANNDTISNIDPNLNYSSWIGVYVSLHNALNDLFLCGVYKDIKIFPTFDARDSDDLPFIKLGLEEYKKRYQFEIVETEPLGFRTKSMGATVIGRTDREIPVNQNLVDNQLLIATRPVGDLAPLTEFLIRQMLGEDASDLERLRLKVLNTMLTPNIEAARVIERYLPLKGEGFDPVRHITSCRDMSGPGLLAIEELAQDSGCDIYLHDIRLHDEMVANVEMPNPTSGTNGAIIIACLESIALQVVEALKEAGYAPWVMGRVIRKSERPTIHINRALEKYPFIKGVHKGIFGRYEFCEPQL